MFNSESESHQMARKALTAYVERLEYGFRNGYVKDPAFEFYSNWTPGVVAAVPVENNIARAYRNDWWKNLESRYTKEEHWRMIMNMSHVVTSNAVRGPQLAQR